MASVTRDSVQSTILEVTNYLDPLLPLANCHTVDFITKHLWDILVPVLLRSDVESKDIGIVFRNFQEFQTNPNVCVIDELSEFMTFISKASQMSLSNFKNIIFSNRTLQEALSCFSSEPPHATMEVNQFMSTKKTHEVDAMRDVVASLSRKCQVSHVVDVGSGKGYLSSMLALHHRLFVLGVDSSHINSHGAEERSAKLKRALIGIKKKVLSCPEENDTDSDTKRNCNLTYKQTTEFVTQNTNLVELMDEKFPDSPKCEKLVLVGLHTCGDLASTSLRLFINNDSVSGLCNVGCCYHLMTEEFSKDPFPEKNQSDNQFNNGFPMSKFLQSRQYCLGRNARMLAAQSVERVSASWAQFQQSVQSLHYRALLQVLLVERLGSTLPQQNVGRLAAKCSSFADYIHKAIKKLVLSGLEVSEVEIESLYETHKIEHYRLQVFHLLRLVIAPVIEGLILLDRLLYLMEQGNNEAFLVHMFDACKSPRCFGLIAIKSDL